MQGLGEKSFNFSNTNDTVLRKKELNTKKTES